MLRQIAEGYGLTCTDFPGGVAPEMSCNNSAAGSTLVLSVIFYTTPALVMVVSVGGSAPLPAQAQGFATDLTRPFCDPDSADPFIATALSAPTPPDRLHFVSAGNCELWAASNVVSGRAFMFLDAFEGSVGAVASLLPIATPAGTPGLLPSPGPSVSPAPIATPGAAPGPLVAPTPGAFAGSIVKPANLPLDAMALIQGLVVAMLALFLVPFPAQLFNKTLEANHDEVRGWFRWIRLPQALRGGADLWRSPIGIAMFIAVSALLYALLDPGLGLNAASAAEVLGIAMGIVATTVVFSLPSILVHRRIDSAWSVRVLPFTLVIGALCVLVSRVTSFEPGYVYGVLLGLTFVRDLDAAAEGRSISVSTVTMVVVGIAAWLLLGLVGDIGDVVGIALRTALAATMVGGLEGAALGLLPLRFQPGERVWAWNRIAWGVLFAGAMFLFILLLINPASGYLADSSKTPLITIVALLLAFGGISVAFWGYFRFRPARPARPHSEPRG